MKAPQVLTLRVRFLSCYVNVRPCFLWTKRCMYIPDSSYISCRNQNSAARLFVRYTSLWRWYINTIIMFLDIIHRPLLFKTQQRFGDWILSPSSVGAFSVLAQSIELVPISGHLYQNYVTIERQSARMSWCQAPIWDLTKFLFLSDTCVFVDVRRPLWREDGSVFYSVQYIYILHLITWMYTVFIVQAYHTSQYVVPRGGIFLGKWRSSAGSSDGKMNVQSACTLNTRYIHNIYEASVRA
jgi:hypothetical protein